MGNTWEIHGKNMRCRAILLCKQILKYNEKYIEIYLINTWEIHGKYMEKT